MTALTALRTYVCQNGLGAIANLDVLERHLMECWDEISGSEAEGMESHKLSGRIEHAEWRPPTIVFKIERHGATVQGSSRAELHRWQIDLDTVSATCEKAGFRQLTKMAARLDVKPMAEEIANLIFEKITDERLNWNADGSVRVAIGKILPDDSAASQTLAGRRKRFRNALESMLEVKGWSRIRANHYELRIS